MPRYKRKTLGTIDQGWYYTHGLQTHPIDEIRSPNFHPVQFEDQVVRPFGDLVPHQIVSPPGGEETPEANQSVLRKS
jgi:hypothetical protein